MLIQEKKIFLFFILCQNNTIPQKAIVAQIQEYHQKRKQQKENISQTKTK